MILINPTAEIYVPDGTDPEKAILRTTHMAIGAHQDDLEIMAYHGIEACFQKPDQFFFGCVVTNGSGSARDNIYKDYTDTEMMAVRKKEQKQAADLGEYGALALLDHTSKAVKDGHDTLIVKELAELILSANPDIIYTHNPADKHDTHVAVFIKVIRAIRSLPKSKRPKRLLGIEVWRDLDWLTDDDKIRLDVSGHPELASSLVEIFDSQISGGKRYDLATLGRRLANATYNASHDVDEASALTYAIDLTPLTIDDDLDIVQYVEAYISRFQADVRARLEKHI